VSLVREIIVKKIDVIRKKRSSKWGKVRKAFLKKHPTCACCGTKKGIEVHHIEDFSNYPEKELLESNLISLCGKRCHILFGHLKNWKSINPNIVEDAAWMLNKIKHRRKKNKTIKAADVSIKKLEKEA